MEVAAVKFVEGRETERFVTLVDPGERIPYEATAVHGITAAMVRGKPRAEQVLQDFKVFIENSVLVAHYAAFDLRIVNDELQRVRLSLLKNAHVCTRNLARAHLNLHSYRLEDVARHLGVLKRAQEHRALGDVLLVAAVYHKLQEHAGRAVETIPVATRSAAKGTRSARVSRPARSRRAVRS